MARKTKRSRHVGKIGWCTGRTLGLSTGHFVYIRSVKNGKCKVNTFTSIERENGTFNYKKINEIKNGNIYPIPKNDLTLPRFSGIDKRVIKDISIHDIKYKGQKTIKGRHRHYINKYMK